MDAEEGFEEEGGRCCLRIQTVVSRVVGLEHIAVKGTLNGNPDQ